MIRIHQIGNEVNILGIQTGKKKIKQIGKLDIRLETDVIEK